MARKRRLSSEGRDILACCQFVVDSTLGWSALAVSANGEGLALHAILTAG
jgi:hypothetical protein